MDTKRQGLELSAFFVGLLYFIVQWVWQMQNSKQGASMPYAYVIMIGVSVTGLLSFHSLLVDGEYPSVGLRVANGLLFGVFAIIGVTTYGSAKRSILAAEPSLESRWLFSETWQVAVAGLAIGVVSYGLARIAMHLREDDADRQGRSEV